MCVCVCRSARGQSDPGLPAGVPPGLHPVGVPTRDQLSKSIFRVFIMLVRPSPDSSDLSAPPPLPLWLSGKRSGWQGGSLQTTVSVSV